MAIKANELRYKAKKNQARMKEILETSADKLTPDQEKEFDALDSEAEALLKQAEKIERLERMELEGSESDPIEQPIGKKKAEELDPEKRKKAEDIAMRAYLTGGEVPQELRGVMQPMQKEKDDNDYITKAMADLGLVRATQTTTTTAGGYTIPRGFMAELEKAIKAYGGMWEAARIIRTAKGNTMDWPTVNDTSNKAYLLAESGSAATAATAVTFGTQPFEAYKYTSGLIQVPTELLQDSEFDIASLMIELLAERIWRGTNEAFTNADGSSKPKGITAAAAYAGSTSNDTALVYDDFVNLEHSVDPGYRKSNGTRFMFHDTVLKEAKKIKDSQNLPIWNPSLMANGAPGTLLGYQYTINQDLPIFWGGNASDNDNDKSILFGDFSKYIIRQVRDMRIVRLNERYGELDQTAFVVFLRVDGDLLNAGTNPVKYLRVSAS